MDKENSVSCMCLAFYPQTDFWHRTEFVVFSFMVKLKMLLIDGNHAGSEAETKRKGDG